MSTYEHEKAIADIEELGVILRSWHGNIDSDSVRIQNMRNNDLAIGEGLMERLVYGVQPEETLQLTVGATAVRASIFNKGAYDFYTEASHKLEPASTLKLLRTEKWNREMRDGLGRTIPRRTLFAGEWVHTLSIDRIAFTLMDGGSISLVEAEQDRAVDTPA